MMYWSLWIHCDRSQTKYQIVLTKTDMVFPMDVARRAMQIEEVFNSPFDYNICS